MMFGNFVKEGTTCEGEVITTSVLPLEAPRGEEPSDPPPPD